MDKLLNNKQFKIPIEFDLMTTCIPLLKCINMFVNIGEILCHSGLDSTSRVALMFGFCKLDHHGT